VTAVKSVLAPRREGHATIPEVLEGHAERLDALALSWYRDGRFQTRYHYRDLRQRVALAASNLIRLRVQPNDRVVVLSNNSPEMLFLLLAVMSLGAIVAPVNPLESPRTLLYIVSNLEPRLVVIGSGAGREVLEITVSCPKVVIGELFATSSTNVFDFRLTTVAAGDTAVILFTSGSTSEPKGVCLSHHNLLTNARGLTQIHGLFENSVNMCVLPLFHANAFGFSMVASLFAGNHVVLCNGLPGFSVWSIIAGEKVNIISVVPQALQILGARAPSRPPGGHLRYFISAAAPLSKEVASKFIGTTGVKIHQGYGMSECVNFATTIPRDMADCEYREAMFGEKVTSVGTPLDGCDVFVRRLDGDMPAAPREEGEIVVTGDTVMSGYWRNEEASRGAIVNGELRTGDLGFYKVLGGRRFFFITGRIKEIIIRQGEKISPLAVESELHGLRAFGEFAVAGFSNAAAGEEIGLYIHIRGAGDRAGIAQLVSACSPLSRPRLVMIGHQDIPATPTGKVKRDAVGKRFSSFYNHVFGKEPLIVDDRA
jgi:acyl-CoA synthetase (AMP-forming)/AMP-acid ligase II